MIVSFNRGAKVLLLSCASALTIGLCSTPAFAQNNGIADSSQLQSEVATLRAELASTRARLAQIETVLDAYVAQTAAQTSAPNAAVAAPPPSAPGSASVTTTAQAAAKPASRLSVQGDLRLRYENNWGDDDGADRQRGVLRARLRAAYAVNDWLTLGAQLATGDGDDPNSTDVTLTGYADDLDVSLDQVYMRAQFGDLVLHGGKIPQPFVRTELVWDGDVSPQGVSAAYTHALGGGANLKASALHFIVDESAGGADSSMNGAQIGFDTGGARSWRFEGTAGYYDYELNSVLGADSGDFRSNLLTPGGRYLSDFDLLDLIGTATYQGFGPRWPVRVVGDYVRNLGAATDADTGFGIDALVGRASETGDWRLSYGYAQAETDAVLAAFSHDNTGIATNYIQHQFGLDYVAARNVILNATFYSYRPKDDPDAGANDVDDWLHRLRLNLLVNF